MSTIVKKQILIVEDEPKIAQLMVDYLQLEGFATTVLDSGAEAVATVQTLNPNFVILDVMLPGKDGLTICKEVRAFSDVPIMMVTAKVDEIDRLLGLELGADDYLCKPFSPREVVARVRSILRRVQQPVVQQSGKLLNYREIQLDSDRFLCTLAGAALELTPVEFRLLHAMVAQPGRVFPRDKLMDLAYTDTRVVSDRTVDSHIRNLRKKFNEAEGGGDLIHSVYGMGYKVE